MSLWLRSVHQTGEDFDPLSDHHGFALRNR